MIAVFCVFMALASLAFFGWCCWDSGYDKGYEDHAKTTAQLGRPS